MIVPQGKDVPGDGIKDMTIIRKPVDKIYLAASSAMCQFDSLDAVDKISLSGIEKDNWYVDSAKEKMEAGTLEYGGKYSAPDYEMIVSKDIGLAIESTMILHTPKVMEKLEKLTANGKKKWVRYDEGALLYSMVKEKKFSLS